MKTSLYLLFILLFGCNSRDPQTTQNDGTKVSNKEEKQGTTSLKNGDLIFHTSQSRQSQAIQLATNSKYSHMGIIYQKGNQYFVYEAVQPVKITPLKTWINRGEAGKYVVKRLKNAEELLTASGIQKMKMIGKQHLNKDYDLRFEWSDNKMYCSELVWKVYKEAFNIEIGQLERLGDFDLSDPIVQQKLKERYGNQLPKEELVITPDQMFNSEKLVLVEEK
ncbi:MAG: YiiX family permuted papain-like enzyme [Saprospiraceae bacterium]|nr:YiiX family permuted papain-like enzyme [Saprospiraceae bacterium]